MEGDNLIAFSRDIRNDVLYRSIPLYNYVLCSLIDDVKNVIFHLLITRIHKKVRKFVDNLDRIGCQKNTYCTIRKYSLDGVLSIFFMNMNGDYITHDHTYNVFERYCIKIIDLKKNIYYIHMLGYKIIVE